MKKATLFTITTKQWNEAIDSWIISKGGVPMSWDTIYAKEGGVRDSFSPDTAGSYPQIWFDSKQTDFSVYKSMYYVYSLWFGERVMSGAVMRTIGKLEAGNQVVDVGGSIFTAYRLLQYGVKKVFITNFDDSPQNEFNKFAAEKFGLNAEVVNSKCGLEESSTLVCSEYLEHFPYVDEEIDRLTNLYNPSKLYESSSFCMRAYGHFIPVFINDKAYTDPKAATIGFRKMMASKGYNREPVRCFNRHFSLFTREQE